MWLHDLAIAIFGMNRASLTYGTLLSRAISVFSVPKNWLQTLILLSLNDAMLKDLTNFNPHPHPQSLHFIYEQIVSLQSKTLSI